MLTDAQMLWIMRFKALFVQPGLFENVDDETYIHLLRIQEYIVVNGGLPTDSEALRVVFKGVEFYQNIAVPAIGPFPESTPDDVV